MPELQVVTHQPECISTTDVTLNNVEHETPNNAVFTLSCLEMWLDGTKAIKKYADPISDGVGCLCGVVCCVAVAFAIAEQNNRPATRGDVVYASQIRHNEAAGMGMAYSMGLCLGDACLDTVSVSVGAVVSGVRATLFSCVGQNKSDQTVFGTPRVELQNVELFDSCTKPACCPRGWCA